MAQGFIIMQIGNADLDKVYEEAIVPALAATGFQPRRVDKHNQGGLLKSEIIQFIQDADIIVADLTNERPNCYLEVGFAMGIDKFKNLILTVRGDHKPDRPGRKPGEPKVHFDLAGYDLLYWEPNDLSAFRTELEKRIRRRLAVLAPAGEKTRDFTWDEEWFGAHRKAGEEGILKAKMPGYIELMASLFPQQNTKSQAELLRAVRDSQIHTFGWPIGIVLDQAEYKPKPTAYGILTEISNTASIERKTYDYWALRRNGDFFLLKSLFEDTWTSEKLNISFNTRIARVAEALLFLARLHSRLGVDPASVLHVRLRHSGLRGRAMTATSNRRMRDGRISHEDVIDSEICGSLLEIEAKLPEHVKALLDPAFTVFDYFEVSNQIYAEIVNNFVAGKVT